jgi:phytoene synthase
MTKPEGEARPAGDQLPPEVELALAYSGANLRAPLRVLFELDARLGRIVATTTEPVLGQLRLAWWRDTLEQRREQRPVGDAVMDAIGKHCAGREKALAGLVNGWEHLLEEPPLSEQAARLFAQGRCNALLALYAPVAGEGDETSAALRSAALRWSYADFAARVSREDERALLVRLGLGGGTDRPRLPPAARGLAVLRALGLRALQRGGRPLMEGRGAALIALRAGLFGR